MAIIKEEQNRIIREYDGEKLWIEAWGKNGIRVRGSVINSVDTTKDWALLPQHTTASICIQGKAAELKNGKLTAKLEENGKISFYRTDGKLLLEEYKRTEDSTGAFHSLLKIESREFKPIIGGNYKLTQRFESIPNEKLYGMGQYQQSLFNLKGVSLELAQRNSQASVPFLLSDQGYGFLWNNPAIGKAVLGTNITEWTAESTKQLDYWVTAGDEPSEIVTDYMDATGHAPMMPDYAMGFWQCKLRYQTQEELLQVAREYKRRGIPLSVIVIDFFHWPNQGTWDFDKTYWPDPKAMVEELKEMGIELMVSVWPTVDSNSPNYEEMKENGYLTHTERGVRTQMIFLGNETFYDTTNPDARKYVWDKCKQNYYNLGIKTFWLDVAEPEYTTYDFENYRYHLGSNLEVGNIYPSMYAKGFYDGLREAGEEKPINLLRCAWAGSQRYGALVWSGDINSTFECMRRQVIAGLHMAIAGIPWWTTDIGGFNNGNPDDKEFRELLIRWFEYGTFCPVMRLHGYRIPHREPLSLELGGGMCDSGADNEIWSFGEEATPILEKFIKIREKMKDYIKQAMKDCHELGIPPMRPLFYDYPNDQKTWGVEDEFLFGDSMLVAPVLYENTVKREVYLPAGSKWTEVETQTEYEGGKYVEVCTPIDSIPVFVKDKTILNIF